MNRSKKYNWIFLCFLFLSPKIYSQDTVAIILQHPFVKCVATVKMTQLNFYLILNLTVTSKTEIIEVEKSRYYVEGSCYYPYSLASGQIYLERKVQSGYVNISTNSFRHRMYDPDYEATQIVDYSHPITDTVNLGLLYPFEPGKYMISAKVYYSYKQQQFGATSNFFDFKVTYLPKVSIFN